MRTHRPLSSPRTDQHGTMFFHRTAIATILTGFLISAIILAAQQAMNKGVDIRGYFVWSFMDNFEWTNGYAPRFGLVYVDYANQCRRIPKDSLKWFSELIKNGTIDKNILLP